MLSLSNILSVLLKQTVFRREATRAGQQLLARDINRRVARLRLVGFVNVTDFHRHLRFLGNLVIGARVA